MLGYAAAERAEPITMRGTPVTGVLLGCCLSAATAAAEIAGRVASADDVPIENARVEVEDGAVAFTDLRGRFVFPDLDPPVALVVSHPRFKNLLLEVTGGLPLEICLELKPIEQEIAVSANRFDGAYAPSSVAASVVKAADLAAPPATVGELLVSAPGVSENGQGGIFQTYSIRGAARLRVLTLLSGMRLISDRRAGVSASFLDPGLIGNVDILRGPSSTYYGSGALGGVIQMFPREFSGTVGEVGFETNGDGARVRVGRGDERWSFGLAHRRSAEGETPSGEILNDGFEQVSGTLLRRWQGGSRHYSLLAIASRGEEIGKSNSDFPRRVTIYPEERHLLVRFAARSETGWSFEAWAHPNELATQVTRDGNRTDTDNEALDLGFDWQQRRKWSDNATIRYGIEYFGRQGVEASELIQPIDGRQAPVLFQMPLDGSENELGLYGAYEHHWGGTVLLLGGRWAALSQSAAGDGSREDTALSGFAGLVVPLRPGLELTANLGSGLRFPSLSERYFSGLTPRGFVTGNAGLETERSRSIDVGMRYYGSRFFIAGGAFSNSIEDYVERVEVEEEQLTFVNLTSGDLKGLELEMSYTSSNGLDLSLGGHTIEGRSDANVPLADVPPDRIFAEVEWERGGWRWRSRWDHRFAKGDPGSGETAIAAAELVSAAVAYRLDNGLVVSLAGRNLLDETYFSSADDKAAMSRGRSLTLTLGWRDG